MEIEDLIEYQISKNNSDTSQEEKGMIFALKKIGFSFFEIS